MLEFNGLKVRLLRRPYQRSIKLRVAPNGEVILSASRSLSERVMRQFLADQWTWVLTNLERVEKFRAENPPKKYSTGEQLLYLGKNRRLRFQPSHHRKIHFQVTEGELLCLVPAKDWMERQWQEPQPQIHRPLRRFYEAQARVYFTERIQVIAGAMQLTFTDLSFRCQKTRWGSCSSDGKISLNWRLMAAPVEVIDYVIIHELAHLVHRNHSQYFWRAVAEHCPDYKNLRRWLRDMQYQLDFLSPVSELD